MAFWSLSVFTTDVISFDVTLVDKSSDVSAAAALTLGLPLGDATDSALIEGVVSRGKADGVPDDEFASDDATVVALTRDAIIAPASRSSDVASSDRLSAVVFTAPCGMKSGDVRGGRLLLLAPEVVKASRAALDVDVMPPDMGAITSGDGRLSGS